MIARASARASAPELIGALDPSSSAAGTLLLAAVDPGTSASSLTISRRLISSDGRLPHTHGPRVEAQSAYPSMGRGGGQTTATSAWLVLSFARAIDLLYDGGDGGPRVIASYTST